MKLFEWRYCEGFIWINEDDGVYNVYMDPVDWHGKYNELTSIGKEEFRKLGFDSNLTNAKLESDDPVSVVILNYWRSIGCPLIDRWHPSEASRHLPEDIELQIPEMEY